MKIILLFLCASTFILPQEIPFSFEAPDNIKLFADHLFCTKDYARAVGEYERYLDITRIPDDTMSFKIGLAYQKAGDYNYSADLFEALDTSLNSRGEYYNSIFQSGDIQDFRNTYALESGTIHLPESVNKQYYFSFLLTEDPLPPLAQYEKVFSNDERITRFYDRKMYPGYKSEINAALFSAIIPGAGKIYTEQYGDGITAFISTLLMAYISYDNFDAGHKSRGWIFGGIAAFLYAGNIYGSAASAQIYNAGIRTNFENDIKVYLNGQNYFMPEYNFCK